MLSTCNSACVDTLTLELTDQCDIYQRSEIPVRLIIAKCNTAFPEGVYTDSVHATAFAALITSGDISATFELTEFQWGDPATVEKAFLPRRSPTTTITTSRQLTAKDYNATDKSSAGASVPYADRLFYKNVIQDKACKIRGYVTDAGKIYLFLNANGEFTPYSINFWVGFDPEVEGQLIEFKNYMIKFVGDPLSEVTTPYLDIIAAGAESTLGWLYKAN